MNACFGIHNLATKSTDKNRHPLFAAQGQHASILSGQVFHLEKALLTVPNLKEIPLSPKNTTERPTLIKHNSILTVPTLKEYHWALTLRKHY